MTKAFQPILIGRYQDKIEAKNASWLQCIIALNHLAENWNSYFKENLDLKELAIILNCPDLKFYIQEKHVRSIPEHLNFIKSLRVKVRELVKIVEIPSFSHLIEAVNKVKVAIYPDPASAFNKFKITQPVIKPIEAITDSVFELWKDKIFDGKKFDFTEELKNSIIEENSVYTKNQRENAAFIFYTKFSELLNVLNDIGHNLETRDFPIHFHRCLNMENTENFHSGLKVYYGEKRYPIRHFSPAIGMFQMPDWNIAQYFENLTDDQVNELIKKISIT